MTHTNLDCVEVREVGHGHRGVFARRALAEGEYLGAFEGELRFVAIGADGRLVFEPGMGFNDMIQLHRVGERVLTLYSDKPAEGIDFVNHSCRPNAKFVRGIVLVAARPIAAGEEITFDYRTTDCVPEGIRCWCEGGDCII